MTTRQPLTFERIVALTLGVCVAAILVALTGAVIVGDMQTVERLVVALILGAFSLVFFSYFFT